jgi:hypothetical protein
MTAAVIYSNGNQECQRMAELLKSLGSEFLEYKLNHHFTQRGFEAEFGSEAEYPQVNIGFKHIGNMKETLNFMKEKGLFK